MSNTAKYAIAVAAALLIAWLYFRQNNDDKAESLEDAAPAPGPPAGAATTQQQQRDPVNASDEPAASAIESRVISLYNSNDRERVFQRNNTRENLFSGLQYRGGTRTVLGQALPGGNPEAFPIIPVTVNPSYLQRLEAAADLEGFEELDRRGAFQLAQSIYRDTFDLSDVGGPNLWPHNPGQSDSQLMSWLKAGLFGQPGPADSNLSERFDAYGKDLQALFKNAARATRSADNHFRAQAIEDLNAAGWQII